MSNDAWGVRDVFGTGVITTSYDPSLTKRRRPEHRWFPWPRLADGCASFRDEVFKQRSPPNVTGQTYMLEPACGDTPGRCEPAALIDQVRRQAATRASNAAVPETVDPLRSRITWWKRVNERLGISYRAERGHNLALIVPLPAAVSGLNVMAAPHLILRSGRGPLLRSAGVTISPSLSRWYDWYARVGWAHIPQDGPDDVFASEAGFRFRVKPIFFHGNVPFLGLRVGLQFQGLREPHAPRFIVEVGGGYL